MVRPITIKDDGGDRYTITTTITTLGRRYDNNAESIVVNFPQAEIDASHICTMIVTAFGKVVDHIEVENGVEVPITSNLSQYSEVKIGFSFTDDENYVKNSETHTFKFLEAQRPDGFVPVPAEQSGNIDMLIRRGFVDVSKSGSYIIFYNLAHEEVARIRVEGGGGGGGCTVYVNGEEVDELSFDSDPQTQIDTINTAIELVQGQLTEKATIEYVDERFNGANKALSYSDYETMITAFNALDDDVYSVGQNVYIVTREVPDLWISSIEETSVPYVYVDDATFVSALSTDGYVQVGYYKFSALETQKVDLTDYVTLNTNQTITGQKTFGRINVSSLYSTANNINFGLGNGNIFLQAELNKVLLQGNYIGARNGDNRTDLGTNTNRWKDLYLAGNISDGTNSLSVADIANKNNVFPVIAPPASATPLTAEEMETFITGCVVNGTFLGVQNPIFLPCMYNSASNEYIGTVIYSEYRTPGSARTYFRQYKIGNSQSYHYRYLELGAVCFAYDGFGTAHMLFNKTFPSYPTDLTKDYILQQDVTTGALSWAEKTTSFNIIDPPASTTLTADELELFKNGVIINGTFLGNKNITFFPARLLPGTATYKGTALLDGNGNSAGYLATYNIDGSNVISLGFGIIKLLYNDNKVHIGEGSYPGVSAPWGLALCGKDWPAYPSNTTIPYKFIQSVGGTLAYSQTCIEWYGTQAQYDALGTYDSNTIYNILES